MTRRPSLEQWASVVAMVRLAGGAVQTGTAGAATLLLQRGGGVFTGPIWGPAGPEGLVCPCYRVRSAATCGGEGRSPSDGRAAAALGLLPFLPPLS